MDMATRMDGKAVSAKVKEQVAQEVAALQGQGVCPGLAVVIVGEDPASRIYVNNKKKACQATGIHSEEYALPASTTQEELLALVDTLNHKEDIHGILVHHFLPCTPAGIMELLQAYDIPVEGKRCVVIGRSNIVGKPMAMLLLHQNGTVTICHSRTKDLPEVTRQADILVSAVGKSRFVTAEMVKPGAVVIDVGMNRDENGKLCGDVDFAAVEPVASYITPVPGGVGPMTIAMLLKNTVTAAKLQNGLL